MLRDQARIFRKFAMLLDAASIVVAFNLAYFLRCQWRPLAAMSDMGDYLLIPIVFIPVAFYFFSRYRLYASLRTRSFKSIVLSLAKAHVIGGFFVAAGIYLFQESHLSRSLFSLFIFLSFLILAAQKLLVKAVLGRIRRKGYNFRHILLVGTGKKSESFADMILQHDHWGFRITGFLLEQGDTLRDQVKGFPVLGEVKDIVDVCKTVPVDEVVFCLSKQNIHEVENFLEDMETLGITVRMTLDFYERRRTKHEMSLFNDEIPMMTFHRRAFDGDMLFVKRCLDVLGSVVGLVILAVLFPFIALAIVLESPGPIFFGQKRVGENGRTFTCWKFRSMTPDAEIRKMELLTMNEVNGAMFKIRNDPRVTAVGRFLRRTSLDELPQFWNVLRGEMSLVGTRPPTLDEVGRYENWQRRRICIKPGITGLWQVSGRNKIRDFDEIVRLDLSYVDNWNLMLDFKILLKTFKVICSGR